jgi:hypothetical protein
MEGAVAEFKEVSRLDPKNPFALRYLPQAEQMRQLLPRLPDVLAGKVEPANPAEACAFGKLCSERFQKRFAAATRLYDGAFKADPQLAADLKARHRYNAACYAARAACGDGIDPPADAAERTALRQKSLGWLRADLVLRKKQATTGDASERGEVAEMLARWQTDSDLSEVRNPEPLAKLPDDERMEWEKFWADVKAALAEAKKPPPPPGT